MASKSDASLYEVRSERADLDGAETAVIHTETRRTDRKTAEQDVEMLKMFGVKAWIVEHA